MTTALIAAAGVMLHLGGGADLVVPRDTQLAASRGSLGFEAMAALEAGHFIPAIEFQYATFPRHGWPRGAVVSFAGRVDWRWATSGPTFYLGPSLGYLSEQLDAWCCVTLSGAAIGAQAGVLLPLSPDHGRVALEVQALRPLFAGYDYPLYEEHYDPVTFVHLMLRLMY